MVPARCSLVTLGVDDVARSKAFYRSLGWETGIDMDDFAVLRTAGEAVAEFLAAGAGLLAAPEAAPWGGYTSIVSDPDGHAWEIAHNPGWPLGADGLPQLP